MYQIAVGGFLIFSPKIEDFEPAVGHESFFIDLFAMSAILYGILLFILRNEWSMMAFNTFYNIVFGLHCYQYMINYTWRPEIVVPHTSFALEGVCVHSFFAASSLLAFICAKK